MKKNNFYKTVFFLSAVLAFLNPAYSQSGGLAGTPLNIGACLDFVTVVPSQDLDNTEFEVRAIELNIGAPVDPFFDALTTISWHEGKFDLEEAWISTVLPLNTKLQFGREFIPFGYLNRIHEHDFPQVDQPYVIEGLTTDHGFQGDGAHLEIMAPLINPTLSLTIGAYQNIRHSVGRRMKGTPLTARVSSYIISMDGRHEVLLGGSYLTTRGERSRVRSGELHRIRTLGIIDQIFGADIKYRFSPGGQTYRGLTIGGEYLRKEYDRLDEHLIYDEDTTTDAGGARPDFDPGTDQGIYVYTHWNFNRFWGVGYRYDLTDVLFGSLHDNEKLTAHSVYGEWRPTEFSRIRAQYQYVTEPGDDPEHVMLLQGTFFLGWHPPHRF